MTNQAIRINKYMPIAVLYFFFNGFLLPAGLLYTTLLTPFFLLWLYKSPVFKWVWLYFAVMAPFVTIHLINGINYFYYLKSFVLLFCVYVFALSFYRFLRQCRSLRLIYKEILLLNIIFVGIALIALAIPTLTARFWYTNDITPGIKSIKRLQMLTYEPSYYSSLLVPIALYYYLKAIVLRLPDKKITLLLLCIPLLLSLSFGVILGMSLSLGLTLLAGFSRFFPGKNLPAYFLVGGLLIVFLLGPFWLLFPNNVFFLRISNVLSGEDTSFRGRTFDSFYLGYKIAEVKSIYFGCGPGQVKEIGLDFFRKFYNADFTLQQVGIPNAVGDTLATFGLAGVALRLFLEVFFFFRTRVWDNYYRLSIFLFIFVYQFTGSFITNIAEYLLWVMAFSKGIFEEFDKTNFTRVGIRKQLYE